MRKFIQVLKIDLGPGWWGGCWFWINWRGRVSIFILARDNRKASWGVDLFLKQPDWDGNASWARWRYTPPRVELPL